MCCSSSRCRQTSALIHVSHINVSAQGTRLQAPIPRSKPSLDYARLGWSRLPVCILFCINPSVSGTRSLVCPQLMSPGLRKATPCHHPPRWIWRFPSSPGELVMRVYFWKRRYGCNGNLSDPSTHRRRTVNQSINQSTTRVSRDRRPFPRQQSETQTS